MHIEVIVLVVSADSVDDDDEEGARVVEFDGCVDGMGCETRQHVRLSGL